MQTSDILQLTTTDPDTGEERTVALAFITAGGRTVIDAAAEPDWYHDILARPMVSVVIGDDAFSAVAVPDGTTVALDRSEPEAGEVPAEVENFADKLMEIHAWLRSQLRHVRAEADAHLAAAHDGIGAAPKPGLGLQLRQHCLAFCQFLEFHHTSEDHMFPALESQHPHLGETVDRLREEHRVVARIQGELAVLLADIGSADPAVFASELDRLSAELTVHLEYEEESLIPILAEIPFPPTGPPQP
ncbi:nitroreductase/quinone reductase family protein [Glycomyces sp. L485]|uniref:nitroreductase/quinone reductase family protein n=1 Tax=Glycomyces sp. L485 TaxID=2909235 RepID=UPI001F4A7C6B|nr:nitroreductase/quinone reductase family protein [Glycomyces sp. L485]MCH7230846.1 nitroreductase/quinone reductase family protein [Glycomyces sp. L485]